MCSMWLGGDSVTAEYCKKCGAKVVLPIEHSLICNGDEEEWFAIHVKKERGYYTRTKENAMVASLGKIVGGIKMFNLDELIEVQRTTNDTLQELLDNVKRSNKILMMVNIVNIATIITLLVVVLWSCLCMKK